MDNWYIIYMGSQVGPISKSQLTSYDLTPYSMVWHPGMADWQPASTVVELADLLNPSYRAEEVRAEEVHNQENPCHNGYDNDRNGYGNNGYNNSNNQANDEYQRAYNQGYYDGAHNGNTYNPEGKSKVATGLLAIFLGSIGVQYFYLGKTAAGFITILLSIVTCGVWEIITFIQGILMICMSDQEFARKYVYTTSTFPLF